ncbi:MAG: DUF3336 domain-containing protein [Pseudomonadota bacterium]
MSRSKLDLYQNAMDHALSYEEWSEAATEYDHIVGHDAWKREKECPLYDYRLIAARTRLLRRLRRENKVERLTFYLREELHGNLGNIANPALYQVARFGTKKLITDYLDEVVSALEHLCDGRFKDLPKARKQVFFKRAAQSFGRSALVLSGGATLGLFHLGVIQELWLQGLLPRVMSGASVGSIIAGVVACHTDDELSNIFDPAYLDLEWARMLKVQRILKGHGVLDPAVLQRSIDRNMPKLTFEEAYARTSRKLNISVSPSDPHQFPRLLNYLTAPHVFVRRAALASSAIPGLFPPVVLTARNFGGRTVQYMPQSTWIDGSVHNDVPKTHINRMHNVNHYIVSQANPHVVPFIGDDEGERGVVPFLKQLLISGPIHQMTHILEAARKNLDVPGLQSLIQHAHAISSQTYSGDVTIHPQSQWKDFARTFTNPKPRLFQHLVLAGRRAVWPEIERIRNTTRISRTFDQCRRRLSDAAERRGGASR